MYILRTITLIFILSELLFSKNILSKSIYFTDLSFGADKTICITDLSFGADKTICLTDLSIGADETYFITDDPQKADKVIEIVNTPNQGEQSICITDLSFGADKTICITDLSFGADKTICLSNTSLGSDETICIINATPREKEIIIVLMSLYLIIPDNKKLSNEFENKNIWIPFEETSIKGKISGSIKKGHIFQTISGNTYEISDYVYLYEYEYNPKVIVLKKDSNYKLIIDGIDEPILCEKLNDGSDNNNSEVIESTVDGDFEGFEGETIIKLMNGQIWQQIDYYYHYHYVFMPKVLIYISGSGYKMKVEGVDKAVGVIKLK